MDSVYRGHEILLRTVSLPNVEAGPLAGRGEIPVDLFQLPIERVAELPKGVVYINYCCLAQTSSYSPVSGNQQGISAWKSAAYDLPFIKVRGEFPLLQKVFPLPY
jgi:hypothetical protein